MATKWRALGEGDGHAKEDRVVSANLVRHDDGSVQCLSIA